MKSVAFSSDGCFIYSAGKDKLQKQWEIKTGNCVGTFDGISGSLPISYVSSLSFNSAGNCVLTGTKDNDMKLWLMFEKKCIRIFKGHTDNVYSTSFSPDERFALSGSRDKTIKLWKIETGKCIRTLTGHKSTVRSVSFSPDTMFVISAGGVDQTVKLWDIKTGNCIHTFEDHTKAVYSVSFSPDGRFILSGGDDNTLRLWEFIPELEFKDNSGIKNPVLSKPTLIKEEISELDIEIKIEEPQPAQSEKKMSSFETAFDKMIEPAPKNEISKNQVQEQTLSLADKHFSKGESQSISKETEFESQKSMTDIEILRKIRATVLSMQSMPEFSTNNCRKILTMVKEFLDESIKVISNSGASQNIKNGMQQMLRFMDENAHWFTLEIVNRDQSKKLRNELDSFSGYKFQQ